MKDKLSFIKSATSDIIHFQTKLYIRKSSLNFSFAMNLSFHSWNQLEEVNKHVSPVKLFPKSFRPFQMSVMIHRHWAFEPKHGVWSYFEVIKAALQTQDVDPDKIDILLKCEVFVNSRQN
jgi:hypothetical protein